MGTADKLIKRFSNKPKDFTFNELKRMLNHFGYDQIEGSGSRVIFTNKATDHKIKLHKPHPGNILKGITLNQLVKRAIKRELENS